jgi:hypothetical protein
LLSGAHALAGALFALPGWWRDRGIAVSAAEMENTFGRLAWTGAGSSIIREIWP